MIRKFALIISAAVIFTGCGAIQVNDRLFVSMMGVRENDGIYELYIQVCGTENRDNENSSPEYELLKGKGRSFEEAADEIMHSKGKELFFGRCEAVITDESFISSIERMKMLADKGVSVGCPVIYSPDPSVPLSMKVNDMLIGGDEFSSILEKYGKDGLIAKADVKTVCEAAAKGEKIVIPEFIDEYKGSAVSSGEDIIYIDENETAALNILRGERVSLNIPEGEISLGNEKLSVYKQLSDERNKYIITVSAELCTDNNTLDIDEKITDFLGAFIERAVSDGFGTVISHELDIDEAAPEIIIYTEINKE